MSKQTSSAIQHAPPHQIQSNTFKGEATTTQDSYQEACEKER